MIQRPLYCRPVLLSVVHQGPNQSSPGPIPGTLTPVTEEETKVVTLTQSESDIDEG